MKNTKETIVMTLCFSLIFSPSVVFAAPQGGKVVGGSASIHQSGATTTINQSSDRAIINWHSFDIGKNEAVRHNMPSRNSAGLHRVVGGGGASQIQGILQSNGNVYLVNPAGVVIHKGARVDTNGFIATTRDISDSNFMNGKMVFDRPGRPDAQIINQGSISVRESGLAALVAPTVRNEGLIAGKLGKVALASGDSTWKLDMHGDDLITFTVDENDVNALHATDGTPLAGVENSGSIKAEGGVVVLTAAQLDGIVGSVVNSGEVSAASAELKGGKITFRGEGSLVDVRNTGTVDASSVEADGGAVRMTAGGAVASSGTVTATGGKKGGTAVLTGREVALTGTAKIDVSGNTGGGTALVGGNALGKGPERNANTARVESGAAIHADAKVKGDGGQVVIWSDEKTSFDGSITARGGNEGGNGGQVETSGKSLKVGDHAKVDTSANKGVHGQWLLDPADFVIAASGGDMTGATLSGNLEKNDVHIESDFLSGISINDSISWHADTTLTLDACRYQSSVYPVSVNADITMYGDNAGLVIYPVLKLNGAKINIYGNSPILRIEGEDFKVLNSIYDIQNIKLNTSYDARYALGADIDASVTFEWNNGKGFEPISIFEGKLDGLGHNIVNLTINRPDENYIGIFRKTPDWAQIRSINLINCNIYGKDYVGSLAGIFSGTRWGTTGYGSGYIENVSITGTIKGDLYIGGIVGYNRGSIIESYNSANIIGNKYVGGISGVNDTEIVRVYNTGIVSGYDYVGGIVGINNKNNPWYYSRPMISNSYNIGKVIGNTNNVGGFYGENNGDLERCFWDITTSQQEKINSLGCQGYDTEKMIEVISTHTWEGFEDFEKYWVITSKSPYPELVAFVSKYPNTTPEPGFDPTPNPDPTPTPDPGIGGSTTVPGTEQSGDSESAEYHNVTEKVPSTSNITPIDKEEKNWFEKILDFIFGGNKEDNVISSEDIDLQSNEDTKQNFPQESEIYKTLDAATGGMIFDYSDEIEFGSESKDKIDKLVSGLSDIFEKKQSNSIMTSLISLVESTLDEMININKMTKKMSRLIDNKLDEPINDQYWNILDTYKYNTKGMVHGDFIDGDKEIEYYIMIIPSTKYKYNFALFEITKTPKKFLWENDKYTFKIIAGTEVKIKNMR